ncbi:Uncharacterised protein [Yersinia rohdei]|uniref:hypothetical protein n=1 Tax=Yersinia rohdei TaxID=29485 RepID=UPI00061C8236|nr:hypothetical protein [Yersinia rohdei]CNF09511.1 Uncharacterised protein [Yersinia rohdei]
MDTQAYRVAVRLALDDQITRSLIQVSRDAIKLNEKFIQMAKNIKSITSSAKEAERAVSSMNKAMSNQFSSATRGANEYSTAMRNATDNAKRMNDTVRNAPKVSGANLMPYLAVGAVAASASGGGGMGGYSGGGGRMLSLPGPSGSSGFSGMNGWKNGIPPGGWGGGGNGGGGGVPPNNRSGRFTNADGMTNLATGYLGFKMLDGFVEQAAKYQTITEKFNQYGLGDVALKDAEKYAAATKITGSSNTDMLRYLTEAQGVFRESGASTLQEQLRGAKLAAPVMAKMNYAMTGLDEHAKAMTESKQMDMLRFVETAGGLKSPERFNSLMNASFKAIQSSGGNVDFSQYRQFMARAGTSAQNLSDKALFASLEPIIGEMKGSTAGFANRTLYSRLNGIIKLPNQVVHNLMTSGIWDESKVELNKMGGIKRFKGNPLVGADILSYEGAAAFYEKVLLPSYKKRGLSPSEVQRENALIGGNTGGMMLNLIDKQLELIHHSEQAFLKARGLDESANAVGGTYSGKMVDFNKKWENLQLAMGKDGGLLDTFTRGLEFLSTTLQKLTDTAKKHPDLAKLVGQTALAVAGFAALSGGMWVVKHAASALIDPLKLVGWGVNTLIGANATTGLTGLAASLGGLPALITGILVAVTAYSAYEVYQWYKNGKTDDDFKAATAAASKGGSSFNVTNPNAADEYRRLINPTKYPAPPPKPASSNSQPVNLLMTHEGRKVIVATVMDGMGKEASRPPASTSAFDSSMLMVYPGQVSSLSTN